VDKIYIRVLHGGVVPWHDMAKHFITQANPEGIEA
jgi:hypothetical protein